jgi:hypothetical protein
MREIAFSEKCDAAAQRLGGYDRIREMLIPIFDGLRHNPEGFEKIGLDWSPYRMIITNALGNSIPALVWLFFIEIGGKVVIDDVEVFEEYLFNPDP